MENFKPSDVSLLAECSWEVCNKIGGIYTVLSTKAAELKKMFGDRLVFIGPDLCAIHGGENPHFEERKSLFKKFASVELPHGLKVRAGRWTIPGSPAVILVDFRPIFPMLNGIYGEMWEHFGVDSLHAYGDYDESCAFAVASAIIIKALTSHLRIDPSKVIGHYNEWTTGMGLLKQRLLQPESATVFTTHATTIGRSICGNGKPLYQYFRNYNGDQMAAELNVEAKHSLEKAAAHNADCFTTVSDVTARECEQLLQKRPDVVTPNGFEPEFVPGSAKWQQLRSAGRKRLLEIASLLARREMPADTLIVATSGRNEFRNKGVDLYLDSMNRVAASLAPDDRDVLALVLVPAWVDQPSGDLLMDLDYHGAITPEPDYLTHRLHNEDCDAIASTIRRLQGEMRERQTDGKLKIVFIPAYLDCNDGIIDIAYYDLLPAIDLTVFASYYEPWGYTPLESIAFGVPTVTTDKAGFGEWTRSLQNNSFMKSGVEVIDREDTNYDECAAEISRLVGGYMRASAPQKSKARKAARATAAKALWSEFIEYYREAFSTALANRTKRNYR